MYLGNHHIVDSIDDSAAQSGGGVQVIDCRQRVSDHCEVVRELELHPLLCGAAVLQQSQAGIPLVGLAVGQGEAAGHVLNELLGPAVVLHSQPLRAVQEEHHVDRPLHAAGHGRLCNRNTVIFVQLLTGDTLKC